MTEPKRRWIVDVDAVALGELVQRMDPEAGQAIEQGRVFVDDRRAVDAGRVVRRGVRVEIYPERSVEGGVQILAEQSGLVLACKPPLLATEPDRSGARLTLLSEVARLLRCSAGELHALSRLDVGVSGVVLLARRRSGRPIEAPRVHRRRYVAIAGRAPEPLRGSWTSAIERGARGPRDAETRYAAVRVLPAAGFFTAGSARTELAPALLALAPVTGRAHQLRLHATRGGAALLGDRAHGGSPRLLTPDGAVVEIPRIALHAVSVEVTTAEGTPFGARAPVPADLAQLWERLGGDDSDFGPAEQENLQDNPPRVA